jgi:hypothetical protein
LIRQFALVAVLFAVVGGGFAMGRATRSPSAPPDPLRLEHEVPLGVIDSRGGAVAAAENFVSTGLAVSLDPGEFRRFLNAVVVPAARDAFVVDNPDPGSGPPPGSKVVGSVVARRVDSYGAGEARVSLWVMGTYWDGGAAPTQYWSLDELSLRWRGERWRIVSGRDSLLGPVPALIAGGREARSSALWDRALAGMSVPYYGDS